MEINTLISVILKRNENALFYFSMSCLCYIGKNSRNYLGHFQICISRECCTSNSNRPLYQSHIYPPACTPQIRYQNVRDISCGGLISDVIFIVVPYLTHYMCNPGISSVIIFRYFCNTCMCRPSYCLISSMSQCFFFSVMRNRSLR